MTDDQFAKDQLKVGTPVFELIEFTLMRHLKDGQQVRGRYGVNVAKVREVVRLPTINKLGANVPGLAGVFELRGVPIPVVNLGIVLGDAESPIDPKNQVVVAEFSDKRAGFIVEQTHRIRRVGWERVLPPSSGENDSYTGMILLDEKEQSKEFLFILDLEKIINDLELAAGSRPLSQAAHLGNEDTGKGRTVLLVEDSSLIRNGVQQSLVKRGFNILTASDGAQAWSILEDLHNTGRVVDVVVTDVEMPKMDGLTLTRKIREDDRFTALPVYLHSSLSGDANRAAGIKVGANGYVVKNDLQALIANLEGLDDRQAVAG